MHDIEHEYDKLFHMIESKTKHPIEHKDITYKTLPLDRKEHEISHPYHSSDFQHGPTHETTAHVEVHEEDTHHGGHHAEAGAHHGAHHAERVYHDEQHYHAAPVFAAEQHLAAPHADHHAVLGDHSLIGSDQLLHHAAVYDQPH